MSTDLPAVGELLGWAARPKETPKRNAEYRAIVTRFLEDEAFANASRAVARGLGLHLHVDAEVGVVASAYPESPLRVPMTDFHKRAAVNERKALIGVALIGVARCAYPDPLDLDDEARVARVSVAAITAYLNHTAEEIAATADDPQAGTDEDKVAWRMWLGMRQVRIDRERDSAADRNGLVRKVCSYLADEGLLTAVSDDDGGTFRATPRLRACVRELARDSDMFAALLAARADAQVDE